MTPVKKKYENRQKRKNEMKMIFKIVSAKVCHNLGNIAAHNQAGL